MSDRYLIVGLGNPGRQYAATKHNVGFMCLDALANAHGLTFDRKQGKALLATGTIVGKPVLLAKPQSFMNLSGDSVSALTGFYKIPPHNLLVVFDDLDLPVGTLRIRGFGGSSGQKGMKHIIERIGTQAFSRIRFGIGRPPGRMDPAAYVLLPFADGDERILVEETIGRAVKAIELWLADGIDRAMNACNGSAQDIAHRQGSTSQTRPGSAPPDAANAEIPGKSIGEQ